MVSDPSVNTSVGDGTGYQSNVKLAVAPDGSSWIAWLDQQVNSLTFGVRLQRLSPDGFEVLPHNGILITNSPQTSTNPSLVEWDLSVDANGNAVLVIADVRAGGDYDVYAYLVDPSGNLPWGQNGVMLSNDNELESSPLVKQMTDGTYVFAWRRVPGGSNARFVVQRLDAAGVPQLAANGVEVMVGVPWDDPWNLGMVASTGGSFILTWTTDLATTPPPSPNHLHSQKFDLTVAPLWGSSPIAVYDASSTYGPEVQSDGAGGAFYAWSAVGGASPESSCWVQHIDASGIEVFPHNGVEVSGGAVIYYGVEGDFFPTFAQLGGDLIVFWRRDFLGTFGILYHEVRRQRISATGQRLWGIAGIPLLNNDAGDPHAFAAPNGAICIFRSQVQIQAQRVDGNGGLMWGQFGHTVSTYYPSSGPPLPHSAAAPDGSIITVWNKVRYMDLDVFAQNLGLNGTLGVQPSVTTYGCGVNLPGSLIVASGMPSIGTTFSLGIDDPTGSMPAGSAALLAIALAPDPAYPCGQVVPGGSMTAFGGPGEILVDLASMVELIAGPAWLGPGLPSTTAFAIPYFPPALGLTVFVQGALFDQGTGWVGLSNALRVHVGY